MLAGRQVSPSAVAATAPAGMELGPREPPYGVHGETEEPCIKQRREAMFQPGESMGGPRAAGGGAPRGVSTCSQLSQLMGASHPRLPLRAESRLAVWYTQTSPLPIPVSELHPPGAPPAWGPSACTTIIPRALSAPPRR